MPSVLDQTFKHTLFLDHKHQKEIERYCEHEIGGRTYYLRQCRGGKKWRISNGVSLTNNKVEVNLDDDGHATILALRYAI
jgi:hypothetical protein